MTQSARDTHCVFAVGILTLWGYGRSQPTSTAVAFDPDHSFSFTWLGYPSTRNQIQCDFLMKTGHAFDWRIIGLYQRTKVSNWLCQITYTPSLVKDVADIAPFLQGSELLVDKDFCWRHAGNNQLSESRRYMNVSLPNTYLHNIMELDETVATSERRLLNW